MGEPAETVRKRRRWPWVLLAAVLLLVGGRIAWRYRPLSDSEKRLVGGWALWLPQDETFRFGADRRFFVRGTHGGEWSASETAFYVNSNVSFSALDRFPVGERLTTYVRMRLSAETYAIEWEGPDVFWWGGGKFVRVPENDGPARSSTTDPLE